MIKELHISNLAVIEDTTLDFETQYTALIGETGAGKSLIVNSLSMLNGERCDFSLMRDKAKKASVSAVFSVSDSFIEKHPEVKDYVDENHEMFVRRVLNPDKTSRCYCNDEILTLNEFREVTSHLIDIHSQNAKSQLLDEDKQIIYVDSYAEKAINKVKKEYLNLFRSWKDRQKKLQELISDNKELDVDYLSFQIAEIEKYHLEENEIEDLNKEFESLRGYDRLKNKYDEFLAETEYGEMGLKDRLSKAISKLRGFVDTELKEQAQQALNECMDALNALDELNSSFEDISADPERIDYINERLFSLKGLQRKYGKTTKEILDKYHDYKAKLDQLKSFEDEKQRLEKQIEEAYHMASAKANELTEIRKKAALDLAKSIGREMGDLGLRKNAFSVRFTTDDLTEDGQDKVAFMVSLNEGLEEAPLAKAASGGESSRLMLALKVVLNALDPYNLLVFDEIDTGVSGKTASLIAKKIKSISKASPIVVISHLPQVVASSTSAVYISKKTKDGFTTTSAKTLNEEEVIESVAKMLSGDRLTDAALSQAKELIAEYKE